MSDQKKLESDKSKNTKDFSSNNFIYIYLIILTIAIAAIALCLFKFTSDTKAKSELNESNLSKQQNYIETFLKNLSTSTEQNFSDIFSKQQKQIDNLKQEILNKTNQFSQNHEKNEIRYLISSADFQLINYNNPQKAITLLEHAKKIATKELNNSEIQDLINNDLTKLKNLKQKDKTEIIRNLTMLENNLSNRLSSKFDMKLKDNNKKDSVEVIKSNKDEKSSFKDKLFDKLEKIVVIRKNDMPTKPIFDEYEYNYILLNLDIYFEALKISILEDNEKIYRLYFKKVESLANKYDISDNDIKLQLNDLINLNFNEYANIKLESLQY